MTEIRSKFKLIKVSNKGSIRSEWKPTCTVQNCDGPPTGYETNSFLDNVSVFKLERLDNKPSGNCESELFSTLNSVNRTQLLRDLGTEIRRLYLHFDEINFGTNKQKGMKMIIATEFRCIFILVYHSP